MKNIRLFIITLSVVLTFGLTGCEEWLDLKPESEIILDEYWQSEADVEGVLAACYRGLTEEGVIYRMMVWGELRSDNVVRGSGFPNARYDMQKILEGDITATNAYASWGSFYAVINYCNNLLYYAPQVVERDINFSAADLARLESEVLTIRALSYFYLVRAFKEVPLYLEPSIDDAQDYNIAKSPENVVIDQIIADLQKALPNARNDFGNKLYDKGRITKSAINALLADVYLWSGKYQEAVAACDQVLADSKLKLVDPAFMYSQVFYLGNSTESIFELQFDDDVQINNAVFNLYGTAGDNFGEFGFPATLAVDYVNNQTGQYSPFNYKVTTSLTESEEDIRSLDSYIQFGGKFYVFKYAGLARQVNANGVSTYFYRTSTPNWIVYRLSDVILMKAEALTQLDTETDTDDYLKAAVDMVNLTYLRSNKDQMALNQANYNSKAEVEKLVLRERQRELMFEGKRWFDLMRVARRENSTATLNDYVLHKDPGSTTALGAQVMDAMYMPIAIGELEANRALVQNPYYAETSSTSSR